MIKKIAFFLFVIGSLILAYFAYNRLKASKEPNVFVMDHIPNTVSCVIETKQAQDLINQLTRQNLIWNVLLSEESVKHAHQGIQFFDSIIKKNTTVADLLNGNSLYWSFVKSGDNTNQLVQFKLKETNDDFAVDGFFKSMFVKNASISSYDVYDFKINSYKWLATLNDGIVYFSNDLSLLQNAINLEKKSALSSNENYTNLVKSNGKQVTQVFVNHTNSSFIDKSLFSKQSIFNTTIELNEITLNGYTIYDSTSFLNFTKNQAPTKISHYDDLPSSLVSLMGISVSEPAKFYSQFEKGFSDSQQEDLFELWNSINDSALFNIKHDFLENISNEILYANYWINMTPQGIEEITIKDAETANQLIHAISDSTFAVGELNAYRLAKANQQLFSYFNHEQLFDYAIVYNDALFLFTNLDAVNLFATSISSGNVLSKNDDFLNYANDNFTQESNFMYFENTSLIKNTSFSPLINSVFINPSTDAISKISFTAKNNKELMQVRINATHAIVAKSSESFSVKALWTYDANEQIITEPHIFVNHTTQENEICFQTNGNNLHLITATGNLLWKKQLNEKVTSKIFTVDLFKNNKYQLLFNTDNYLHLIDRNGNYVDGFPVKTSAKITSPINLINYDNTKDPRIFIACADKKIYNFSLYGVKTEGFSTVNTDAVVNAPIRYCRVGASDYLVTVDVEGKIYVFSRKGEGRIDFKNKAIKNLQNFYLQASNNIDNTKLIFLDDKDNLLTKISFIDKKEITKIGDELSGFQSQYGLVNDDTQEDVIVYGNGAVYGYDLFSNKLFESFNQQAIYSNASIIETSSSSYCLAFDSISHKIDMVNTQGKLMNTITNVTRKPLSVNLFKDGKNYLLLINDTKIWCEEVN